MGALIKNGSNRGEGSYNPGSTGNEREGQTCGKVAVSPLKGIGEKLMCRGNIRLVK
jgi:hypothetical protein